MSDAPIILRYTGEGSFEPSSSYWARKGDERFIIGQLYTFEEMQERSTVSHRAYFAQVREAWMNLPEHLASQYPTPDHLRKYALIKAGYFNSTQLPCATKKAAHDAAKFVQSSDDYAIVTVTGTVVTRYTAKSQSYRAMPKGEFQESKDKTLAVISDMLGISPKALSGSEAA